MSIIGADIPHTQHQFAKRDGEWVNALTEKRSTGAKYFCDCPNGGHAMKLRQWRGIDGTRRFRSHFSIIDSSTSCQCAAGESDEHFSAKHRLREWMIIPGRILTIVEKICCECNVPIVAVTFDSDSYEIDVERRSDGAKWRYDCVVKRRNSSVVEYVIEVVKTHFCSREKLESVCNDGLGIAEVMASYVHLQCDTATNAVVLKRFDSQKDQDKCSNCIARAASLRWGAWYNAQRRIHLAAIERERFYKAEAARRIVRLQEEAEREENRRKMQQELEQERIVRAQELEQERIVREQERVQQRRVDGAAYAAKFAAERAAHLKKIEEAPKRSTEMAERRALKKREAAAFVYGPPYKRPDIRTFFLSK
jgi:hypothetical protein